MDVFAFRRCLIDEYASYVGSLHTIRDDRIREYVAERLQAGDLWPEPLIQLNPSFEPAEWIDELVEQGVLHEACSRIFRIRPAPGDSGRVILEIYDAMAAANLSPGPLPSFVV